MKLSGKSHFFVVVFLACLACGVSCSRADDTAGDSSSIIVTIDSRARFEEAVEKSEVPVLVDFWATWCPPCRFMNPVLKDISSRYRSSLVVAKVDVDQNRDLAGEFKIESIPAMILFVRGKPVDMVVGARDREELVSWISERLKSHGLPFVEGNPQHAN